MVIFHHKQQLQAYLQKSKANNIAFVPTMGALHQGHLSLIISAKQKHDFVVCSIFVNPTQFNDKADFAKYPITIEADILLLEKVGCSILYLPSIEDIYPDGTTHLPHYPLGQIESILEGVSRPGHFQGVCQVVHKLLLAVPCQTVVLGKKDYQQCMVIQQLIQLHHLPVNMHLVDTKRNEEGLALSSRNMRLTEREKKQATAIYQQMNWIKNNLIPGSTSNYLFTAEKNLLKAGFNKIDYISIADAANLQPVNEWNGTQKILVLVAAFIGGVRLIDNMVINS